LVISTDEPKCSARKEPKIGPEGGERVSMATGGEIEEGFRQGEVRQPFSSGRLSGKMNPAKNHKDDKKWRQK
jgi:hypothetical protein